MTDGVTEAFIGFYSGVNETEGVTEAFIGFYSGVNETEFLERCGVRGWVHSLDTLLGLLYLTASIVGISENCYVFFQMYQTIKFRISQARASFFIFVGNLAVGDVMILTLPIWYTIKGLFNYRNIDDEPGSSLTVTTIFIYSCCARSSIIFVMLIALFRVISVRYPLHIGKVFSIPRTIMLAVLSWVLVVVCSSYSFDGTTRNAIYSKAAALCMVVLKDKTHESLSVAGQILLPFLIPGVITCLALFYLLFFLFRVYYRKMSKLRSNDSSYRPARERDSLIMTVKLTVCFVVFYTPWYIDGILEYNNTSSDRANNNTLYRIHNFLTYKTCFGGLYWHNLCLGGFLFLGSAANPLLYGRTLVHTSQQNVNRGLVSVLYTIITTRYRRLRGVDENEVEQQDVEIVANNSQIMLQAQRQHSISEKDSSDSQDVSKQSISEQPSGSTAQLVTKPETKKKDISRHPLIIPRVESKDKTDSTMKMRAKYCSTRDKRI